MKNKKNVFYFLAACVTILVLVALGIQANIEVDAKYHKCMLMRDKIVADFFGDPNLPVKVSGSYCFVECPVLGVPTWVNIGEVK